MEQKVYGSVHDLHLSNFANVQARSHEPYALAQIHVARWLSTTFSDIVRDSHSRMISRTGMHLGVVIIAWFVGSSALLGFAHGAFLWVWLGVVYKQTCWLGLFGT